MESNYSNSQAPGLYHTAQVQAVRGWRNSTQLRAQYESGLTSQTNLGTGGGSLFINEVFSLGGKGDIILNYVKSKSLGPGGLLKVSFVFKSFF